MSTIGFVGLEAMGGGIAGRLLASGHEVHGTNPPRRRGPWLRHVPKAQPLIDRGLRWHATSQQVAATADVVISMVSDDAVLEAITGGPDGILAGLTPGKLYVDMSTVSREASVTIAERARSIGARMLDAPVSGSVPQAEAGTLTIMVGGEEAAFRLVEPLLRELGQTVTRVGGNGHGLLHKLACSLSVVLPSAATADDMLAEARALGYAERDIAALHQVLARLPGTAASEHGHPKREPALASL